MIILRCSPLRTKPEIWLMDRFINEDVQPEATNITPETLFYRFCTPQELECVANGGDAGKFWLNAPYYGSQPQVYMRTPWGNLGTTQQASYGDTGQQVMTADGSIQDHAKVELVEVLSGSPEPRVKPWQPLVWTSPPLEMVVDRELEDGTPLVWLDSFETPKVAVNYRKFNPRQQFSVTDVPKAIVVQRFDTAENAMKFASKYLKDGFAHNLANRS